MKAFRLRALALLALFALPLFARAEEAPNPTEVFEASAGKKERFTLSFDKSRVESVQQNDKRILLFPVVFQAEGDEEARGLTDVFTIEVLQGEKKGVYAYPVGTLRSSRILNAVANGSLDAKVGRELPDPGKPFLVRIRNLLDEEAEPLKEYEARLNEEGRVVWGQTLVLRMVSANDATKELGEKGSLFVAEGETPPTIEAPKNPLDPRGTTGAASLYTPTGETTQTVSWTENGLSPAEIVFTYQPLPQTTFYVKYLLPDDTEAAPPVMASVELGKPFDVPASPPSGYRLCEGEENVKTTRYDEGVPPEDLIFRVEPDPTVSPAPNDVPVPSDVPPTTDAPIPSDVPHTTDVPVSSDVPPTTDVPVSSDVPPTTDAPSPSEGPAQPQSCEETAEPHEEFYVELVGRETIQLHLTREQSEGYRNWVQQEINEEINVENVGKMLPKELRNSELNISFKLLCCRPDKLCFQFDLSQKKVCDELGISKENYKEELEKCLLDSLEEKISN